METQAEASERGNVDIALIKSMRDGLLRASEAAALTWDQIKRNNNGSATTDINRLKKGYVSMVYFSPATVQALDAIRPDNPPSDATVFDMDARKIARRIKASAKAAGLTGVTSHGARVGMAQDLIATKGVDIPVLMQAGGWRNDTMPARYTRRQEADAEPSPDFTDLDDAGIQYHLPHLPE